MEKHLLIIRHGTAAPALGNMSDFDRPLTDRGKNEVAAMATLSRGWFDFHKTGYPEKILVSASRRTTETAGILKKEWKLKADRFTPETDLYLPSLESCLEFLWGTSEDTGFLTLCSHNPGMEVLGNLLFGPLPSNLSPCGMILGKISVPSWDRVDRLCGELLEFRNP